MCFGVLRCFANDIPGDTVQPFVVKFRADASTQQQCWKWLVYLYFVLSDSHGEIWVLFACQLNRWQLRLERGKAFHAFRRFRTAHLRKNRVPWDLQKLWLGHANRDVTDRYAEQLKEDVEWRKEVAENTGLGFELPAVERSVGLLGLPSGKKMKVKKAA